MVDLVLLKEQAGENSVISVQSINPKGHLQGTPAPLPCGEQRKPEDAAADFLKDECDPEVQWPGAHQPREMFR